MTRAAAPRRPCASSHGALPSADRRACRLWFAKNTPLDRVHYDAGQSREAADSYWRDTELEPENAWAFQKLGTSLWMEGDLDGAYEEAVHLEPASGTIRRSLGDVCAKAGDTSERGGTGGRQWASAARHSA